MMKIFTAEKIREIDAATIRLEPVTSVDLMERAGNAVFQCLRGIIAHDKQVLVFAGTGNNGGDGLVIARLLHMDGFRVHTFVIETGANHSPDMEVNLERLKRAGVRVSDVRAPADIPHIDPDNIIIDAVFGTGLNKPPMGVAANIIRKINSSGAFVISVDIPSGLFCDDNSEANLTSIIRAGHTITFQFPKLAFMFPDSVSFTGAWEVVDIGLHEKTISVTDSNYYFTCAEDVIPMIRKRKKFDYKGSFGHALIIAGSYGKAGAAIMASEAALRTGAGLVTVHAPASAVMPLQAAVREAMVSPDPGQGYVTTIPDLSRYNAVAAGPGLGTDPDTRRALTDLFTSWTGPLVIDADALNILAMEPDLINELPDNTILTPHPGEFSRLTGSKMSGYRMLDAQNKYASQHKCIVVLKGAYTSVALPDGRIFFNSTGNPGMATAGSGDVLTGMIVSLLAQGYSADHAAIAGVFLHGAAGDMALEIQSQESLIAGDIIKSIGLAFRKTLHETV